MEGNTVCMVAANHRHIVQIHAGSDRQVRSHTCVFRYFNVTQMCVRKCACIDAAGKCSPIHIPGINGSNGLKCAVAVGQHASSY